MSNVLSLDHGRRISRDRTIRAPLYESEAGGLSVFERAKLTRLEESLFCSGTRQAECRSEDLHIPDGHYECGHGAIWFHFSRRRSMFVLTAFTLTDGGGGLRMDGWDDRSDVCDGSTWGEELVARRAIAIFQSVRHRTDDRTWVAWTKRPTTGCMLSCDGSKWSTGHEPDISDVVVLVHQAGLRDCDINSEIRLPEWSILNGIVKVSQQIGNPYARLVLAGEALCRVGEALRSVESPRQRGRSCDATRRRSTSATSLLDDSVEIISALSREAGSCLPSVAAESFVTSCLMDRDGLGHGRDLCLVQSEMTLRFAEVVAQQASALRGSDRRHVAEPDMARLMRKFALLGRFAASSSWYFGTTLFWDDACFGSSDRQIPWADCGDIHEIKHFGLSTNLLMRHLVDDHDSLPQGDEMMSMRDKLMKMVREIVDPI